MKVESSIIYVTNVDRVESLLIHVTYVDGGGIPTDKGYVVDGDGVLFKTCYQY